MTPRMLTAAACRMCGADRPLTNGACSDCSQPYVDARWRIVYDGADGQPVTSFVVKDETRDMIVRCHPLAVVVDLSLRPCDPCGGECTDMCDAGAGTWPERQAAEEGR